MDFLVDRKRINWNFGSISAVAAVLLVFSVEYYCFVVVFTNHLLKIVRISTLSLIMKATFSGSFYSR